MRPDALTALDTGLVGPALVVLPAAGPRPLELALDQRPERLLAERATDKASSAGPSGCRAGGPPPSS